MQEELLWPAKTYYLVLHVTSLPTPDTVHWEGIKRTILEDQRHDYLGKMCVNVDMRVGTKCAEFHINAYQSSSTSEETISNQIEKMSHSMEVS